VNLLEQNGLRPTIYRSVHLSGEDHIAAQQEAHRKQGF